MAIQFVNLGSISNTFTVGDDDYVVTGANGSSTLTFGQGNDQLDLGNGNNTLTFGGGTDLVTAGGGNNSVTANGAGADTLNLGGGNNTVTLGNGADRIGAGDGMNTITVGDGNDSIAVGNGFDKVTTGNGNSRITAGDGPGDTITVGTGANVIYVGVGAADVVKAAGGGNAVYVSAATVGGDSIQGGLNTLDGTGDRLSLTTAGNVGMGGVSGFDVVRLADGGPNAMILTDSSFARLPGRSITVVGGAAGNTLDASGLAAANSVAAHAGAGVDSLTGGAGNDAFYAGTGSATINGGAGFNTVTYAGLRSSYSATSNGGVTHVVGAGSSDTLTNVQQLIFADGIVSPANLKGGPSGPSVSSVASITNVGGFALTGRAEAGSAQILRANGSTVGTATADASTGAFSAGPNGPLALGANVLTVATTTAAGTSAQSAGTYVFEVQAQAGGVSATDFSSADLGGALDRGAAMAFSGGTQAVTLTDGVLSVGTDTNEATIQRLYKGLLGRGADAGGMTSADARLAAGAGKAAVAASLIGSAEYVARQGTQSDDKFVSTLYQGLTGRPVDVAGAAGWMAQLAQGASRGSVAVGIADSAESKAYLAPATAQVFARDAAGTMAHELYEMGLGREVELSALASFKSSYASMTATQLAASVAGSQEFSNRHAGLTSFGYVSSLYHDGFGRAPDAASATYWTGRLDAGTATRLDLFRDFAASSEAAVHLTRNIGA